MHGVWVHVGRARTPTLTGDCCHGWKLRDLPAGCGMTSAERCHYALASVSTQAVACSRPVTLALAWAWAVDPGRGDVRPWLDSAHRCRMTVAFAVRLEACGA
jgi:hypothetical protein